MAPSGQLLLVTVNLKGKSLSAAWVVQAFTIYATALLAEASTSKKQLAAGPHAHNSSTGKQPWMVIYGFNMIKVYREWAVAKEIRKIKGRAESLNLWSLPSVTT